MTSEIHRVKNAISLIFCTKTTEWCVKGKNPLGLIPYKDGFSYDDNVCWQGVEERFLFYYFQDWVVYVEFRVYFLQAASVDTIYIRGRCPRLLRVVPSRHRSACGYGCWRRLIRGKIGIQRIGKVYSCLSPCDGCKDPAGWWCGWLKISKLTWGFSDGHSINGSQETSCINRKGFLLFLSYVPLKEQRWG